jgi:hypothetical protein
MKVPSTGKFDSTKNTTGVTTRGGPPPSGTRADVDGESSPRLPHERDESSDSGTGAPSDVMHIAHDDGRRGRREERLPPPARP